MTGRAIIKWLSAWEAYRKWNVLTSLHSSGQLNDSPTTLPVRLVATCHLLLASLTKYHCPGCRRFPIQSRSGGKWESRWAVLFICQDPELVHPYSTPPRCNPILKTASSTFSQWKETEAFHKFFCWREKRGCPGNSYLWWGLRFIVIHFNDLQFNHAVKEKKENKIK